MTPTPTPTPTPSLSRSRLLRVATRLQDVSALSFSAFLVLHLAAPIGAAVGLDASGIMLLAREYYQTGLLEPILVWGSLSLHVLSSVARRALLGPPKRPSIHSLTGFLLVPTVAIHAWAHRILPARKGISPTWLSYAYVSYALQSYPVTSWAAYAFLSLAGTYHAIAGARAIASRRRKAARLPSAMVGKAGYAAVVGSLGLGLVNLAGQEVPLWLGKRYLEVLQATHPY